MIPPSEALADVVAAIHATPQQVVIEFAGAGAMALAWLHSVGGSSRTILEATDRYAAASLTSLIGIEPDQFTSPQVARAMATKAYIRACNLAAAGAPVAGVSCTAAIATDRTKRGDHRCCISVCTETGVWSYELTLVKGLRSRLEEEHLVSSILLRAIAKFCRLADLPGLDLAEKETLSEDFEAADLLTRLAAEEFEYLLVGPDGRQSPGDTQPRVALLSGAFDPLHKGHRQLAEVAAEILEQEVYFDLSLVNAGKGKIDLAEIRRRLVQFAGWGTVILSRTPLYSQKANLFPHSVFVVGADKVEQLFQVQFYNNDPAQMAAAFETIRTAGCRFLVGGREQGGRFMTLDKIEIPVGYREMFEQIPEEKFRVDISSTLIRTGEADR